MSTTTQHLDMLHKPLSYFSAFGHVDSLKNIFGDNARTFVLLLLHFNLLPVIHSVISETHFDMKSHEYARSGNIHDRYNSICLISIQMELHVTATHDITESTGMNGKQGSKNFVFHS